MNTQRKPAPLPPPEFEGESFSILDSDFDSIWAPPLTLETESAAPVLLEGWRVRKQGVR